MQFPINTGPADQTTDPEQAGARDPKTGRLFDSQTWSFQALQCKMSKGAVLRIRQLQGFGNSMGLDHSHQRGLRKMPGLQ